MSGKIQKQLESLINKINQLDNHYYVLDNPIVSDEEYDQIYRQLKFWKKITLHLLILVLQPKGFQGGY